MIFGDDDIGRGGGGFGFNRGPKTINGSVSQEDNIGSWKYPAPSSSKTYDTYQAEIDHIRKGKGGTPYRMDGGKGWLGGENGQYFGWGEDTNGYPCNGLYNVKVYNKGTLYNYWTYMPDCPAP